MNNLEIISLVVTIICLLSFCAVFTVLFKHYYDSSIVQVKDGKEDLQILKNAKDIAKAKNSKKSKVLNIIGKVLSYTVFALIIVIFSISLYSRFSGNAIPFGNSSLIVIASGSMSEKNEDNTYLSNIDNQFNTYDIIGISSYENQNDIELYDVVAFKNEEGTTIVHRIIEILDNNGEEVYITRGDSNNTSDNGVQYKDYLRYENIIGYYNGTRIQSIGIFIVFLQSNAGIITIVAIAYCLFMFDYYSNRYEKAVEDRTNLLISTLNYDLNDDASNVDVIYTESLLYKNQKSTLLNGEFVFKTEELKEEDKKEINEYKEFLNSQEKVENNKDFEKKNYFQKSFQKIKEKFFESKNNKTNDK